MKYLPLALALTLMINLTRSQRLPADFNPNTLAQSQGLGYGFALYSSDTASAILFNPARAPGYDRQFLYVNYRGKGSDFSGTALFKTEQSWWLLEFSHSLGAGDSRNSGGGTEYQYGIWDSVTQRSDRSQNFFSTASQVKLSKIVSEDDRNSSYGLFAIIQPSITGTSETYDRRMLSDSSGSYEINFRKTEDEYSWYAIGLEYATSTRENDFVGRVSVQKAFDTRSQSPYAFSSYSYDFAYSQQTYYTNEGQSTYSESSAPLSILASAFYQHNTSFFSPNEHLFGSLSAYASQTKLTYNHDYRRYWQNTVPGNASPMDTISQLTDGTLQPKMWGASLSLGYVTTKHFSDLDWFVGINPNVSYDSYTLLSGISGTSGPSSSAYDRVSASVACPLYVRYAATTGFSVFGGIVYIYDFRFEQSKTQDLPVMTSGADGYTLQYFPSTSIVRNLGSHAVTFLGVDLRHASGFDVQIKFNTSIAENYTWYISAGLPL